MAAKVLDGRYKLIKTLGAGGFGRTYIARDMRRPGTPLCVVKQLKPASDDPAFIKEARRLFNTEAETLEKLGKHDQIPQLLAYFEEDRQFFLVQEFVDGRSLYDEFKSETDEPQDGDTHAEPQRGRQLTEPEVVSILKDILSVLEFVHAEGVIHRDIKPDNLIRRKSDGKLVLIDFGAVKQIQEGNAQVEIVNGQSRFTVTIGTPGYMPSEQCAGRPNFSSDLYAVGMVAIQALTGYSPTDLPTDPDSGELIWRNQCRATTGLVMVLTRMTRYHYTQRYQSVKEVLQGMNAFTIAEEPEKSGALVKAGDRPNTAASRTQTVPKRQAQSNSGSELLVAGLLAVVAAVAAFTIPLLTRKSTVVSSPTPTVSAVTTVTPEATPAASPIAPTPPTEKPTTKPANGELVSFSQSLPLTAGTETTREGTLKANQLLVYTVNGQEGQSLRVDLSGDSTAMTLLGPNQEPLDTRASLVSSWEGKLAFSGTYQIQLQTGQGSPQGSYKLKVLLNDAVVIPDRSVEVNVKKGN